jgi:Flp pilus assembly protein TadG
MSHVLRLVRNETAASAAEFALVLPLLLILLFGIIDVGRFMWEYNEAEKATQMGVRYAVVTDPALNGLYGYSFATGASDLIPAGTTVPTANFTSATCTSSSCTCTSTTGGFCGATSLNSTAFNNVATRMALMYPPIKPANVRIDYQNVGVGFSGNPDGPDVSPLVTVKLQGLVFRPMTCVVFACSISMPDFRASLTLEDASGSVSN